MPIPGFFTKLMEVIRSQQDNTRPSKCQVEGFQVEQFSSVQFRGTVGIYSGYSDQIVKQQQDELSEFQAIRKLRDSFSGWRTLKYIVIIKAAQDHVEKVTGYYPSLSIILPNSKRVVYKEDWGCPTSGEQVIGLESTLNRKFDQEVTFEQYESHMTLLMAKLMESFGQKSGQFTIQPVKHFYMVPIYDPDSDLDPVSE